MKLRTALTLAAVLTPCMAAAQPSSCPAPTELSALPAAIDAFVTGKGDRDRSCERIIFLPDAHLSVISTDQQGKTTVRVMSVDDWIASVKQHASAEQLQEKQIKVRTETYGNLAHLWSTYNLYVDGKLTARGINSIQAAKIDGAWRVYSILWQAETPATPLPKKYLP